jgi:hypothetical protein
LQNTRGWGGIPAHKNDHANASHIIYAFHHDRSLPPPNVGIWGQPIRLFASAPRRTSVSTIALTF